MPICNTINFSNWDSEKYNQFIKYLFSLQDTKYKEFHSKLTLENNLIGIRTPILKKIAKDISKTDYKSFLKYNQHEYYEEIMIHGLLIGYIDEFEETITYLDDYYKYITNWATCDLTCSNLKIFKKNLDKGFIYINKLIKNSNPWIIRVGVVLLLDYYINEKYLDKIFKICDKIKCRDYYVKMAIAWLISICYIKYPIVTKKYLNDNLLDDWTYNKAIQKIKESNRIESKKEIELLKRSKEN